MSTSIEALRRFYSGRWYPIVAALLIFLGHCTTQEVFFCALLLATVIPALLICRDLRFAILPFLCTLFIVSVQNYTPRDPDFDDRYLNVPFFIFASIAITLLLAAGTCFVLRNRKTANRFPRRGMFWSMAFVCAVFALNGSLSPSYAISNLVYVLLFSASWLLGYVLFVLFLRFDKTLFDYFMYCLVICGLLIFAELIHAYFTTVQFVDGEIVKESVILGWGVWTNIGAMLAMLMPACFYFARSHKWGFIAYGLGFLEFFGILLSQSRGALLVGILILLLCLVYLCVGGTNRKQNRILTLCVAVVGVLGVVLLSDKLISLIRNFMEMGFFDNGRFDIWKLGIQKFFQAPIFGSGFYDSYITEDWNLGPFPYLYHCTVIQVLGATGIAGTFAYFYHRFDTVRLVAINPNPRKTILGIAILALLLFSLIDVMIFIIYPTMYYSLMLLFMEHSEDPVEAL